MRAGEEKAKGEGRRAMAEEEKGKGDGRRAVAGSKDLLDRTREFALRVIAVFRALPREEVARVLGRQLLRSGTSVGAHYREAQRAKSFADFISKIEGALQELEETRYWLELLTEAGIIPANRLSSLHDEATQLIAIFMTIARRTKRQP